MQRPIAVALRVESRFYVYGESDSAPAVISRSTLKVIFDGVDRLHEERVLDGGMKATRESEGADWRLSVSGSPPSVGRRAEADPLDFPLALAPWQLLFGSAIHRCESRHHRDRPGYLVEFASAASSSGPEVSEFLPADADRHDAVIDDETGILLRLRSWTRQRLLEEHEVVHLEVGAVKVDPVNSLD